MKYIFDKIRAKHKKGFTLLEHLVVVLILAVLTAIAVPTYNKVMRRSRVADGLNMLDVLASAQNKYFITHGSYANNLNDLNTPIKSSHFANNNNIVTTNFTYQKDEGNSCIFATSRRGEEYTLAKNYRTNSKIKCYGPNCNDISSYVIPVNNEDALCTDNDSPTGCDLTEEKCHNLYNMILNPEPGTCECIEKPAPPSQHCEESEEPRLVDLGNTCGSTTCGHEYIKYVCKGGEWLEDGGVGNGHLCLNTWLYNKCAPNAPYLPNCSCNAPANTTCEHQSQKYQVGQSYFTDKYEDDTNNDCKSGINKGKCFIKHYLKVCAENGSWNDGYECEDKATYCANQGKVIDNNCNCVEPDPNISCEHNAGEYQLGSSYSEYVDDGSCVSGKYCLIKYVTKTCVAQDTWKETNSECRSKEEYCAQQGLVLNNSCNCVQEQTTCNPNTKPSWDGDVTSTRGVAPPPAQNCTVSCGYLYRRAKCNMENKQWEEDENGSGSICASYMPKTQNCQGEGTAGSSCGIQHAVGESCELNDGVVGNKKYYQLSFAEDFHIVPAPSGNQWSTCALPTNDDTACWEGATEVCTINGKQGIKTCTGCHWGECVQNTPTCPTTPNPSGSNIRACNNGNPELYCGTQTGTAKCDASTGYKWIWDFTNAPCEHVQTRDMEPIVCTGANNNCRKRIQNAVCQYSASGAWGAAYYWSYSAGSCTIPIGDEQCVKKGSLGGGIFCDDSCHRKRCNDSTYNSNLNTCVKSQDVNHTGFFYNPNNTSTAYTNNYHDCETYGYTINGCNQPSCKSGGYAQIHNVTNLSPDAFCSSNSATLNRIIVKRLDNHPGNCSSGGNIYTNHASVSLSGRFFKCISVTPVNP